MLGSFLLVGGCGGEGGGIRARADRPGVSEIASTVSLQTRDERIQLRDEVARRLKEQGIELPPGFK